MLDRPDRSATQMMSFGRWRKGRLSSVRGDITRSDQFVASGESVSAVHVSPDNRKVVRLCGSQRGSQPMLRAWRPGARRLRPPARLLSDGFLSSLGTGLSYLVDHGAADQAASEVVRGYPSGTAPDSPVGNGTGTGQRGNGEPLLFGLGQYLVDAGLISARRTRLARSACRPLS